MMVYILFSVTSWESCRGTPRLSSQALQGCAVLTPIHRGSWHKSCQWVPNPRPGTFPAVLPRIQLPPPCHVSAHCPCRLHNTLLQHLAHQKFLVAKWETGAAGADRHTHTLGGCQVNALRLSPAHPYLGGAILIRSVFSCQKIIFSYLADFSSSFKLDWRQPARLGWVVGGTWWMDRTCKHHSPLPLQTRLLKLTFRMAMVELYPVAQVIRGSPWVLAYCLQHMNWIVCSKLLLPFSRGVRANDSTESQKLKAR